MFHDEVAQIHLWHQYHTSIFLRVSVFPLNDIYIYMPLRNSFSYYQRNRNIVSTMCPNLFSFRFKTFCNTSALDQKHMPKAVTKILQIYDPYQYFTQSYWYQWKELNERLFILLISNTSILKDWGFRNQLLFWIFLLLFKLVSF
jgi:hypothetical protein